MQINCEKQLIVNYVVVFQFILKVSIHFCFLSLCFNVLY